MKVEALCPACREPKSTDQDNLVCLGADGNTFTYAHCGSCGLYCITPLLSAEQLATYYDTDYYGKTDTKFIGIIERLRTLAAKYRAHVVKQKLTANRPDVLDIGCGNGQFLRAMLSEGCEIYGTEISGHSYDRACSVKDIHLHEGTFSEKAFNGKTFDAITLWHVLEHIPDPDGLIQHCYERLVPGGWLFVEVPNISSWQARLCGDKWLHLDPPRHLFQFTGKALTRLFTRAGFEICQRRQASLEMGVMGLLQGWLNAIIKPRDLLYAILHAGYEPRVPASKQIVTLLFALCLAPAAVLFALIEILAGKGAVVYMVCRKMD